MYMYKVQRPKSISPLSTRKKNINLVTLVKLFLKKHVSNKSSIKFSKRITLLTFQIGHNRGRCGRAAVKHNCIPTSHPQHRPLWQIQRSRTLSFVGISCRCKISPVTTHGRGQLTFRWIRQLCWKTKYKRYWGWN